MRDNVYEGLFILNSDLYARNPEEISGQIDRYIEEVGGEVLVSRLWQEIRLAYPIKGHRRGTYWLTYFKVDTQKMKELNRQCQIIDSILRHLFIQVDPRLVDTLVEHAKAGPIRPEAENLEGSENPTDSAAIDIPDVFDAEDVEDGEDAE